MKSSTVAGNPLSARGFVLIARRGPLKLRFQQGAGSPRLMFAVPKSVGTAVVRNRCRRRVREMLRELAREGAIRLEAGEYRLSVFAPLDGWSPQDLKSALTALANELADGLAAELRRGR